MSESFSIRIDCCYTVAHEFAIRILRSRGWYATLYPILVSAWIDGTVVWSAGDSLDVSDES